MVRVCTSEAAAPGPFSKYALHWTTAHQTAPGWGGLYAATFFLLVNYHPKLYLSKKNFVAKKSDFVVQRNIFDPTP